MPWAVPLLLWLLAASAMADPLTAAETGFRALDSYRATVRTVAADGERRVMRYFYRKPGWVRIEMLSPYRGAVLIYDPDARRVRLWPFGTGHVLSLSLAPDNRLVRDPRGHRIDRSHVGALLDNLQRLRAQGHATPLGATEVDGRAAIGVEIAGEAGAHVDGVHRYRVWFARDTHFPLRVESFAADGRPIETVDLSEVETGAVLPERLFQP
ncbi:LolA family protein [Thauera chlorobenzoica]|nr:sigma-E factor regulatory protein RseB domain-containing protein [Thauera chlorobenzoica]SEF99495.1 Outer membrane lipoprotein-sorting protein [Thauera chlorobenzoica]